MIITLLQNAGCLNLLSEANGDLAEAEGAYALIMENNPFDQAL